MFIAGNLNLPNYLVFYIKLFFSFLLCRGRRMLGVLQATLTQFKAETSASAGGGSKRARQQEIESRIDARAAEEKAAARQERAELFRQRKQQQVELGLLEQKMRMMNEVDFVGSPLTILSLSSLNLGKPNK